MLFIEALLHYASQLESTSQTFLPLPSILVKQINPRCPILQAEEEEQK